MLWVVYIIVFRSGLVADLVQSSGFEFWQDHRVGRVNFFKNQNDVILEKKITGCNQVLPSLSDRRVIPSFDFLYFFFSPPDYSSRSAGPRVDPSRQARFQNYPCRFDLVSLFLGSRQKALARVGTNKINNVF